MPNVLDADGLQTATEPELVSNYTKAYQTIYGPDINLASDTPDGQWMNIQIQATLDQENLITQVYNSFNPDNAIGTILDQRVAINGIQRQSGTYTVTNVTIVTNQSVNLFGLDQSAQPVYTVSDAAGNQWQLISTQLGVGPGTLIYSFQAANVGSVVSIPNTITIPVVIVLGVVSVNNPTTYTVLGINEESDAALKIRRQKSVSLPSQGYLQGLLAALENINGVVNAFVYENDSGTTNPDGVPGHSIWVIVDGNPTPALAPAWNSAVTYAYGQLVSQSGINYISWKNNNVGNLVTNPAFWGVYNPVAEAIYNKRNAGCGMFGSTSYSVTQIDGTQFIINWDVVTAENLFIKFTASSLDGINPPNIAGIVQELPSIYMPGVFAEVNINQLATLVQSIDPNTLVTNAGFNTAATGSFTNTLTPTAKNFQFFVSTPNIIILPMILSGPNVSAVIVSGLVTHTVATIASGGSTIQFTGLGGYGTLSYSITTSIGSTVNPTSGLYTSGSSSGTDTVMVTDGQSHTTFCTVTVT